MKIEFQNAATESVLVECFINGKPIFLIELKLNVSPCSSAEIL